MFSRNEESKPNKWKSKVNRVNLRKQFGVQELGCSDTMLEIEEHSEEQEREMFNLESRER